MKKIALMLTAVLFCAATSAQKNTTLKLNPEKNKTYRFRSISDQNISQTINGVEQTSNNYSEFVFSIKMVDATKDFIIAEIRFDTILIKTNAGGKIVEMNSVLEGNMASSETADVMSAVVNRLSRNPLFVKMDPTGKVNDIINYTMLSQMVMNDTALITGQAAPALKMQVVNTVSFNALKSMIEMFTNHVPGKEVKTGEEWSLNTDINSGGMSLNIATSYKLNAISSNIADISGESSIKPSINAEPMEYSGAKITYDRIGGMSKSTLKIDTTTGLVIENASRTQMAGDLDVSVQGMNLQIPMSVSGEAKVSAIL